MKTTPRHRAGATVLLAAALTLPACTTGFRQTEEIDLDKGYSATQAAMKDLEFKVTEQAKDALQAQVTAEEADRTRVKVSLEKKGDHVTEFRISVGTLGDDSQSRLIMGKIKQRF